jgi:dihydropteroate synthase
MRLRCGDKTLDLSQPAVMGVLNVTPDSFSDGGRFVDPERAVAGAARMAEQGAVIIDVGGESTRPGANPVDIAEELRRVIPIVEKLAGRLPIPISVDTSKPEVMRAAIDAGAGMINDVYALRAPGAIDAVASSSVAVCLMHMQGEPRTMQNEPRYEDVVSEVHDFLEERMQVCLRAGISRDRIVIDPGFGFGKNLEHNLKLLTHLNRFTTLGVPILAGLSRKSMIAKLLNKPVDQRLAASLALATIALLNGARLIRAHDVSETIDAVHIATAALDAHYS